MKNKNNIFDVIEGYYIANLLIHLNNQGFFQRRGSLRQPAAKRNREAFPDPNVLQFLQDRTDIIIAGDKGSFTINPRYHAYMESGFPIEKFLGAYGQFNFSGTGPLIAVDEKKFAQAFGAASAFRDYAAVLDMLAALKARSILDLGCGAGNLLVEFCRKSKLNKAFGIDQNAELNHLAKDKIKKYGLRKRAKAIKGDVTAFDRLLSAAEMDSVDAVFGSNILNEFFASPGELTGLLSRIKKYFAGRHLIVADYYGSFGTPRAKNSKLQHNYVHDIMQLLTGQGVPPGDYKGWNDYYRKAGCELAYVYEGTSGGINWFIHIVRLPGPA